MKTEDLDQPAPTSRADLARLAGLCLIATGGLFGSTESGILDDLLPAAAASLIFLLSFLLDRRLTVPIFFWSFLTLALLTLRNLSDPRESLSLAGAAIAFLAGANLRADDLARRVVLGAAVILGVIALYQRFIIAPELIPVLSEPMRAPLMSGRIFSTFVMPAQYGAYLALVLPLILVEQWVGRARYLAGAGVALTCLCIYLNGSFSALIAASAAILYLLGLQRRSMVAILGILILFFGVLGYRHQGTLDGLTVPITWRLGTWRGSVAGMMDAPILGHGTGSFLEVYNTQYRLEGIHGTLHPHSWPVKIGFEEGAVGLAAFLLFWSALLSPPRDRSWRAAAIAFGVAMFLDVADHSATLRALGLFALGASLKERGAWGVGREAWGVVIRTTLNAQRSTL